MCKGYIQYNSLLKMKVQMPSLALLLFQYITFMIKEEERNDKDQSHVQKSDMNL